MARDAVGYAYDFRDAMPPSDEASGALETVSVRASDNDGFIVSCRYERGLPEDYVFEDLDGALKYLKKQLKKLGAEDDEE